LSNGHFMNSKNYVMTIRKGATTSRSTKYQKTNIPERTDEAGLQDPAV
jgi:hypothetical protein